MAKKAKKECPFTTRMVREMELVKRTAIALQYKLEIGLLKPSKRMQQNIVNLSYGMSAKMIFVLSLSTSNIGNCNCEKNKNIPGSICQKCFADSVENQYNALHENNMHNLEVLSSNILPYADIMAIAKEVVEALIKNGTHLFRLESFGDLANVTHCVNYIRLCSYISQYAEERNYPVSIAWWTKQYHLFENAVTFITDKDMQYFRKDTNVILSSLFIGVEVPRAAIEKVERWIGMKVKVFTVYNLPETHEKINCGARSCTLCQRCYTKQNYTEYVAEALK